MDDEELISRLVHIYSYGKMPNYDADTGEEIQAIHRMTQLEYLLEHGYVAIDPHGGYLAPTSKGYSAVRRGLDDPRER